MPVWIRFLRNARKENILRAAGKVHIGIRLFVAAGLCDVTVSRILSSIRRSVFWWNCKLCFAVDGFEVMFADCWLILHTVPVEVCMNGNVMHAIFVYVCTKCTVCGIGVGCRTFE